MHRKIELYFKQTAQKMCWNCLVLPRRTCVVCCVKTVVALKGKTLQQIENPMANKTTNQKLQRHHKTKWQLKAWVNAIWSVLMEISLNISNFAIIEYWYFFFF